MTVYAMSSISTVNVGPGHGGCGQKHDRPLGADGRPVQPWAITCAQCSEHLRHDQHFATSAAEIPATFDEAKEREQIAVRGNADRESILALAMAKLAGLDLNALPASIARPALGAPVQGLIACPSCQAAQPAGGSYCASCGSPMRATVPAAGLPAPAAA